MRLITFYRMLIIVLTITLATFYETTEAQGILTRQTGSITFFSSAPLEDIQAVNTEFTTTINLADSSVVFTVPVEGFVFPKKLMQEHFNDQYMESSKYPIARFQGKLTHLPQKITGAVDLQTRVKGILTIRDISRTIDEPVSFTMAGNNIAAVCEFMVRPADYGIKIPKILIKNIAEEVKVTVKVIYSSS